MAVRHSLNEAESESESNGSAWPGPPGCSADPSTETTCGTSRDAQRGTRPENVQAQRGEDEDKGEGEGEGEDESVR